VRLCEIGIRAIRGLCSAVLNQWLLYPRGTVSRPARFNGDDGIQLFRA
jgi:hypothetical protein